MIAALVIGCGLMLVMMTVCGGAPSSPSSPSSLSSPFLCGCVGCESESASIAMIESCSHDDDHECVETYTSNIGNDVIQSCCMNDIIMWCKYLDRDRRRGDRDRDDLRYGGDDDLPIKSLQSYHCTVRINE